MRLAIDTKGGSVTVKDNNGGSVTQSASFAITGTKWNGPRFFGLRSRDLASLNLKAS